MRIEKHRLLHMYDKVQQAKQTQNITNKNGTTYAILFNSNQGRHSKDLYATYHALKTLKTPTKINILEGNGNTNQITTTPATILNLENTINQIKQEITPNDTLFFYVTNHGKIINQQSTFYTYDGEIKEQEFKKLTENINLNFGVFYFSQCHSGGFAETISHNNYIGISNTNKTNKSYGQKEIGGSYFTQIFLPLLFKENITIETAFELSAKHTTNILRKIGLKPKVFENYPYLLLNEIPQLRWQNADPSKLYLNPKTQE